MSLKLKRGYLTHYVIFIIPISKNVKVTKKKTSFVLQFYSLMSFTNFNTFHEKVCHYFPNVGKELSTFSRIKKKKH